MRVLLAGPVEVDKGEDVHFSARLPRGLDYAYCQVFSAVGEYEASPHVPEHKLQLLQDGKPVFANPTTIRLTRIAKPKGRLTLTAYEKSSFYLYQEVDVKGDQLAKVRIKIDGKFTKFIAACRRACGR